MARNNLPTTADASPSEEQDPEFQARVKEQKRFTAEVLERKRDELRAQRDQLRQQKGREATQQRAAAGRRQAEVDFILEGVRQGVIEPEKAYALTQDLWAEPEREKLKIMRDPDTGLFLGFDNHTGQLRSAVQAPGGGLGQGGQGQSGGGGSSAGRRDGDETFTQYNDRVEGVLEEYFGEEGSAGRSAKAAWHMIMDRIPQGFDGRERAYIERAYRLLSTKSSMLSAILSGAPRSLDDYSTDDMAMAMYAAALGFPGDYEGGLEGFRRDLLEPLSTSAGEVGVSPGDALSVLADLQHRMVRAGGMSEEEARAQIQQVARSPQDLAAIIQMHMQEQQGAR
jgi:hypothetical protein